MATAPTPACLETLLLYCEEEVEGEAYFDALASLAERHGLAEKLRMMAAVDDVQPTETHLGTGLE